MKQTAVEWFKENIAHMIHSYDETELAEFYQQALEMEKQQIIESNRDGVDMCVDKKPFISGEQYYNEDFKADEI